MQRAQGMQLWWVIPPADTVAFDSTSSPHPRKPPLPHAPVSIPIKTHQVGLEGSHYFCVLGFLFRVSGCVCFVVLSTKRVSGVGGRVGWDPQGEGEY